MIDSDSQNTREHAVNVVNYLERHNINRFVLVTSLVHMKRSVLTFREMGTEPVPSPSLSWVDEKRGLQAFWPSSQGLNYSEQVMHEYFGLIYYLLLGWV